MLKKEKKRKKTLNTETPNDTFLKSNFEKWSKHFFFSNIPNYKWPPDAGVWKYDCGWFSLFLRNLKIKEVRSTQGRDARNTAHVMTSLVDLPEASRWTHPETKHLIGGAPRESVCKPKRNIILLVCFKSPWEVFCKPWTFPVEMASPMEPRSLPPKEQAGSVLGCRMEGRCLGIWCNLGEVNSSKNES